MKYDDIYRKTSTLESFLNNVQISLKRDSNRGVFL